MQTLERIGAGRTLFLTFSVFKASLIVEGSMTSKAFLRHFPVREGDGCMKDTDHLSRHRRVHLGDRATAQRRRSYAWRDDHFGRGQNIGMGWSDPTFAHGSVPKVMLGVAPAHPPEAAALLPVLADKDSFDCRPDHSRRGRRPLAVPTVMVSRSPSSSQELHGEGS